MWTTHSSPPPSTCRSRHTESVPHASARSRGTARTAAPGISGAPNAEFAPNLWLEGLGETVRRALVVAVHDDVPGAAEALRDLESRGLRSGVFHAVVNRLADQLEKETRRAFDASLN